MAAVTEYVAKMTPAQRKELGRVRKVVRAVTPEADEKISYGVLAFTYKGKNLLYFGAFKDHMSLFPASDGMIEAVGTELAKFRVSKGTLRFTTDKPIPDTLLKALVQYRVQSIRKD